MERQNYFLGEEVTQPTTLPRADGPSESGKLGGLSAPFYSALGAVVIPAIEQTLRDFEVSEKAARAGVSFSVTSTAIPEHDVCHCGTPTWSCYPCENC